jgi:hypothetical protein
MSRQGNGDVAFDGLLEEDGGLLCWRKQANEGKNLRLNYCNQIIKQNYYN